MTNLSEDQELIAQIAAKLQAMAHPVRLMIIGLLKGDELAVGAIAEKLDLTLGTVSQHLKILKNSGVLTSERKGTIVCYKLKEIKIMKIIEVLRNLE